MHLQPFQLSCDSSFKLPLLKPVDCCTVFIEEGFIQMRRQRSSLLFEGQNLFNSLPRSLFYTQMIWRKRWIAREWYEEKDDFILFFESSWCKIDSEKEEEWKQCCINPSFLNVLYMALKSLLSWQLYDSPGQGRPHQELLDEVYSIKKTDFIKNIGIPWL